MINLYQIRFSNACGYWYSDPMSWLEALDFCEREKKFQDGRKWTRLTASTTVVAYSESNTDNRRDIDDV